MHRFDGEDRYGLLKGLDQIKNGNQRKMAYHNAWMEWEKMYGVGSLDYLVYILSDESKPGEYKFGPLTLYYKPFYVGQGKCKKANLEARYKESSRVGRQRDKGGEKVDKLELMKQQNKKVHIDVIQRFHTEPPSKVLEMKLLHTIPKNYLTNCEFPYTRLKLEAKDFIQPQPILFMW